jgi:hypothetical protein
MRLIRFRILVLATLVASLIAAQKSEGSALSKTEEEKIKQVQEEMTKASLDGDAALFVKRLADGYTNTLPDGTVLSREQVWKRRTSGKLKISSLVISDLHIRVRGDSAVANFKAIVKSQFDGRDTSGTFQITRTWIKERGEWKVAADQMARITGKK